MRKGQRLSSGPRLSVTWRRWPGRSQTAQASQRSANTPAVRLPTACAIQPVGPRPFAHDSSGKRDPNAHDAGLLDEQDEAGCTALHYAADRGHAAAVRWLVEQGADVTIRDDAGCTALHLAAASGKAEAAQALVSSGSCDTGEQRHSYCHARHRVPAVCCLQSGLLIPPLLRSFLCRRSCPGRGRPDAADACRGRGQRGGC